MSLHVVTRIPVTTRVHAKTGVDHAPQRNTIHVVRMSRTQWKCTMTDDVERPTTHPKPRGPVYLSCKHCHELFEPVREWQAFCTPKHRNLWHTEQKEKAIKRLSRLSTELVALALKDPANNSAVYAITEELCAILDRLNVPKDA